MMILYLKRSYFKHAEEAGDVRPRCKQITLVTLHMTGKVNKWGYIFSKLTRQIWECVRIERLHHLRFLLSANVNKSLFSKLS